MSAASRHGGLRAQAIGIIGKMLSSLLVAVLAAALLAALIPHITG
jgi:hypothetical protein